MKKKYLFIGVGLSLLFILIILILLTFNLRRGMFSPTINNTTRFSSDLPDYSGSNFTKPPNAAIENVTGIPKNTQSSSLSNVFNSPTPRTKGNNNNINNLSKLITPTSVTSIDKKSGISPTSYLNDKKINKPTLSPSPTPYQFTSDDPDAFQFMGTKLGPGTSSNISSVKLRPVPTFSPAKSDKQSTSQSQYRYFSQCDGGFDDYPMPEGCNMCEAGCGPTTLAMILSTYLDKTLTPADVVEIYKQNGYYAGCDGTKITDAQAVLDQNGLQTTDYIMLITMAKEDAIAEMKKYIDAGWTLFVLGRYCGNGCSHFFWVTNIDQNNKVWSYDPFYNKDIPPPLDVNNYNPFPEYRIAFGVKR